MTQAPVPQTGPSAPAPDEGRRAVTTGSLHRWDKTRARRSRFLRRFGAHKLALTGGLVLFTVTLVALLGPALTPSPLEVDTLNRLQPPNPEHPFGTDNYGRDVLARVVEGARVSLFVGAFTAVCTAALGCAVGLYAAYNRVADMILMRLSDGLMAFPAILLAIAIMAALGPRTSNIVFALTIVFTPYVARIVRSSALVVKEQTFVEALRAQGASTTRIVWINMAPNVLSPLIVQATFVFADSIITEAALSFLGAGVPPPAPSWGNILLDGKTLVYNGWWMTVFPGLFIMATILSINLLGDGLRDLLDPTYRGGRGRRGARKAGRRAPRTAAAPAGATAERGGPAQRDDRVEGGRR